MTTKIAANALLTLTLLSGCSSVLDGGAGMGGAGGGMGGAGGGMAGSGSGGTSAGTSGGGLVAGTGGIGDCTKLSPSGPPFDCRATYEAQVEAAAVDCAWSSDPRIATSACGHLKVVETNRNAWVFLTCIYNQDDELLWARHCDDSVFQGCKDGGGCVASAGPPPQVSNCAKTPICAVADAGTD